MKRTAWLLQLCWRLPPDDPERLRLQPILLRRFAPSAANDTWRNVERAEVYRISDDAPTEDTDARRVIQR